MAEVKWIKIVTDIFDDEKVLLIESMPEADTLITCWFKLLCLAGKQNNSGVFLINNRIPYTDEMFATIFRRPLNTVRLALETFEHFGMIERVDGCVTIPNWDKHQSLDAYEKKKEYQRNLMRERRAKQKELALISEPNSEANCYANSEANCYANSEANVSPLDKIRREVEGEEDKNINNNSLFLSTPEKIEIPPQRNAEDSVPYIETHKSPEWHEQMADRLESLGLMQGAAFHREDAARLRRQGK